MSEVLDRETRNALFVAIHEAIVATFDEGDWRSLGFQMDMLNLVKSHPRLLKSLNWRDADYPGHALTVLTKMLDADMGNLEPMLQDPKIIAWLRENKPELCAEFFDDAAPTDASPHVDHAKAIRYPVTEVAAGGRERVGR